MLSKIQIQLEKLGVKKQEKLLLAVSGGMDSMAMLFIFRKLGFEICVAHCNYQLRGRASDLDAELVQRTCTNYGVLFYQKRIDTEKLAKEKSWSIQQAAREVRYEFFNQLIFEHKLDLVCTAHHKNDDFETSILALNNANFFKGISGIPSKRDNIIRPLLGISRKEIKAFVEENNIEFREDESNESKKYKRNFVRHEIVPALENINPNVLETFQKFKSQSELAFSFLEQQFLKWTYANKKRIPIDICRDQSWLLWMWWKSKGGNWAQFEELRLVMGNKSGLVWETKQGVFMLGSTYILFQDEASSIDKIGSLLEIEKEIEFNKDLLQESSAKTVFLNAERIDGELKIEFWKEGMRFNPFGMNGSKLVSDYFTDQKIDFGIRQEVPILCDDKGIVWIVGYRMDERFRINEATKKIWKLTKK